MRIEPIVPDLIRPEAYFESSLMIPIHGKQDRRSEDDDRPGPSAALGVGIHPQSILGN